MPRKREGNRTQKHYITSVNLGEKGNLARVIVEKYVSEMGGAALSELIRSLLIAHFSDNPKYRECHIKHLKYRRKQLGDEIYTAANRKREIEDKLTQFGLELEY